jgi:Uma2 family endonuclease
MSLEEFLALPEEKPSLELIDGEVCQKPMGKIRHSRPTRRIMRLLEDHPATRNGEAFGELTMPFPGSEPPNARVPDAVYFTASRIPSGDEYPAEPPDLAIEVRSRGQTLASQQARLAFLRERGVPATLLIDPEEHRVYLHDGPKASTAGVGDTVTIDTLGGFSFRVDDLFA